MFILLTFSSNAWVLVGGVITIFLGLTIAFIEHKKLIPQKITFGIILAMAGFISSISSYIASIENDEKTEKIIKANIKIDSLVEINNSLAKTNNDLSNSNSSKLDKSLENLEEIISKSSRLLSNIKSQSNKLERVTNINREIQDYQTGGNSYPFFFITLSKKINSLNVFMSTEGSNPIRNLQFTVIDELDTIRKRILYNNPLDINYAILTGYKDIAQPKLASLMGDFQFIPTKDSLIYVIQSFANNGNFVQIIKKKLGVRKNRIVWLDATQIKRNDMGQQKILYENIDPDWVGFKW